MKVLLLLLVALLAASPQDARREDSLRRVKMAELFLADDRDGFLEAARGLIDYHRVQGNEKQLYNAYATLFDRQQMWGRYDDSMATLEEMSALAQEQGSNLGVAISEFCFGQFYLTNRQPQEAQVHYRRAFTQLQELGENGRAIRAGFNLQASAMNLNQLEEGLAINDSTQMLLVRLEQKTGRLSLESRLKQVRYRFVLLQRLGRMADARPLKDTLLYYVDMVKDPGQDEIVLTAIAQFEQRSGNKAAAYACIDTLIQRAARSKDFARLARFRLSLADFQRDNGDLSLAVDNYRAYAAETDSAQIHRTNEQLNVLTKKYELNELRLKNKAFRTRVGALTIVAVLLLVFVIASLFYARSLQRKNRALYQASMETIHAEEQAEQALVLQAEEEQSPEERLYAGLVSLMLDEQLFKDPELSRDTLCARLGTNRTYLSSAVKKHTGLTLGEFINHHRLRWAAEALAGEPELSVIAVGEDCGISSRSTFHRLFQEQFGMSPSAYRSAANG